VIGTKVSHYEITGHLGSGGMGAVYRARDTKLKRDVAIKVLPSEVAQDPERLARAQREGEVLASLNNPHIAQIYGREDANGTPCLILEYVDGQTLQERIQAGPIPVHEALELAGQIADALQAAHELGIVHRDLKPANIKITSAGEVKVLDFGLAKIPDLARSGALSHSPTMVGTATGAGTILGTSAYMSPEQAKGKGADARSDIWAFGIVLYEMLTGKMAYPGETVVEILGGVLKADPDWTALPSATPPLIVLLLRHCLQKEPNRRLRHIADARFQIEEAQHEPVMAAAPAGRARKGRDRLLWITAILAIAAVSMLAALSLRRWPADAPEMRVQIASPAGTDLISFVISPDGRNVVFWATKGGRTQLWRRPIDSETAQLMAGTENATYPFWSPDSKSVAFFADGQLKRTDIAGGIAQPITSAPQARGGTWGIDGTILFSPANTQPLHRVASGGGQAVPALRLDPPRQTDQRFPQFLPDGRHFIFFAEGTPESTGVYRGSLDSMETSRLFDSDSAAVFLPPGYVGFARQRTLLAQRLDPKNFEVVGDPFPLADRVSVGSPNSYYLGASASMAGALAYQRPPIERRLVWLTRSGQNAGSLGEPDAAEPSVARISPDGRTVALTRTVNGKWEVWLIDAVRGVPRHFTSGSPSEEPVWSNDGNRIAFGSEPKGVVDLYEKAVGSAGTETLLAASSEHKHANDWSPDGRFIVYTNQSAKNGYDIWALPLFGDRKPFPIAQMPFNEVNARFSPDGHWIAYQSNETGRDEIVIQPFPGPGAPSTVSSTGGTSPQWRRDGRELFYLALDNRLMAAPVTLNGQKVDVGIPVSLFSVRPQSEYAALPDGQRFLINTITEDVANITLILNWHPPAK
jgi:Tol biopolymer transport system component